MGARATDRLSLAVSGLLVGGIVLIALSMVLQERSRKPSPAKPVMAAATPAPAAMPTAIRLPPPPVPSMPAPTPTERIVKPLQAALPAPKATPPRRVAPLRPAAAAPQTPPAEWDDGPTPVIEAARNRKEGGALLRLLEHGKGPTIEIAWPRSASDRLALYRLLTRCYGMQAAVLNARSRLFASGSPAGESWDIDRDRVSGFLRAPQGEAIPEESRAFARIARHHALAGWRPVRVFPRDVDAALLGGLAQLLGPRYRSARSITAAYRSHASGLKLDSFRIDGTPVAGGIALAPHRAGCG